MEKVTRKINFFRYRGWGEGLPRGSAKMDLPDLLIHSLKRLVQIILVSKMAVVQDQYQFGVNPKWHLKKKKTKREKIYWKHPPILLPCFQKFNLWN